VSGLGGIDVGAGAPPEAAAVLSDDALALVARLHRDFEPRRQQLLEARAKRRAGIAAGEELDFLERTRAIREGDWTVAPAPAVLRDRRVEITGPTDRKMVINALNSGASGFMADFEDANSPTWANMIGGQRNLIDAVAGTISLEENERRYTLDATPATLLVRPRGWHLVERGLRVGGDPVAGALVDAGFFLFHNARALLADGAAPSLYLPKLESHLEARLWRDVLASIEDALGLDRGSVRVTVLIETVPAAFEMEEILYELREHVCGLNAGRWDYIFSMIKVFAERPQFVLPDRARVTMTVPFMRAYTKLLVRTCHRRGAHAMGGMAALIPSRRDPEANARALDAVREDKRREAGDGFDGTWVAHPDLVPVARACFDDVLGERPNQLDRTREDVVVGAADLLDAASAGAPDGITEAGLRNDVDVCIRYIASWLGGVGAVAINGLMEDAATAEIARAQVWQWVRHGAKLDSGAPVDSDLVRAVAAEQLAALQAQTPDDTAQRSATARELFEAGALAPQLPEFLTLAAYERLQG